MQQTVFMLKPDAFINCERHPEHDKFIKELPGEEEFISLVKSKLEEKELVLLEQKKLKLSQEQIESHYAEHKPIPAKFNFLKEYIALGPVLVMLWEGEDAIALGREALLEIRTEFLKTPTTARKNMTHASDSIEAAENEKSLYF